MEIRELDMIFFLNLLNINYILELNITNWVSQLWTIWYEFEDIDEVSIQIYTYLFSRTLRDSEIYDTLKVNDP